MTWGMVVSDTNSGIGHKNNALVSVDISYYIRPSDWLYCSLNVNNYYGNLYSTTCVCHMNSSVKNIKLFKTV